DVQLSDEAIFGGKTKHLPARSLEIEAGLVGILDLLHAEVDQPSFDLWHIFRFDFQPCCFQVIFLGKHVGLLAKEDAENESVGEQKKVQVRNRVGHRRALKDIEVERPYSLPKALVDVELHVVADDRHASFLSWTSWTISTFKELPFPVDFHLFLTARAYWIGKIS